MEMYREFSRLEVEASNKYALESYNRWRHDRKDIYRACDERYCPDTLGIRIFYKLHEAHCNPDMDW